MKSNLRSTYSSMSISQSQSQELQLIAERSKVVQVWGDINLAVNIVEQALMNDAVQL